MTRAEELVQLRKLFRSATALMAKSELVAAGADIGWIQPPEDLKVRVWNDDSLRAIVDDILGLVDEFIPKSFASSIRAVVDHDGVRGLAFVAWHGKAWTDGNDPFAARQLQRITELDASEHTLAQAVFRTQESQIVKDVNRPPDNLSPCPSFQKMKGLFVAPIFIGGRLEGVLDLRSRSRQFTATEMQMGEFIASQVGVILETISVVQHLRSLLVSEVRLVQDLEHQLATPLNATANLLDLLYEESGGDKDLWTCRQLARHTARIANAADLFVRLAQSEELPRDPQPFTGRSLMRKLDASIEIARVLVPKRRRVRFKVKRGSFIRLKGQVWCDETHLEQAVGQVLDNAGKYSYDGTEVQIEATRGKLDGKDVHEIHIASDGAPIRPQDIEHVTERTWRGPDAEFMTAKGRGIGLWITEELLTLNGGGLNIHVKGDRTTVRLALPKTR